MHFATETKSVIKNISTGTQGLSRKEESRIQRHPLNSLTTHRRVSSFSNHYTNRVSRMSLCDVYGERYVKALPL